MTGGVTGDMFVQINKRAHKETCDFVSYQILR